MDSSGHHCCNIDVDCKDNDEILNEIWEHNTSEVFNTESIYGTYPQHKFGPYLVPHMALYTIFQTVFGNKVFMLFEIFFTCSMTSVWWSNLVIDEALQLDLFQVYQIRLDEVNHRWM